MTDLTTISAGQEGIDSHWWSHTAVHWNTSANPVDSEQREDRVHRYGGHVIRKNNGQPQQEDLSAFLQRHGGASATHGTLDLRPDGGSL
jgi:hypothetical protein